MFWIDSSMVGCFKSFICVMSERGLGEKSGCGTFFKIEMLDYDSSLQNGYSVHNLNIEAYYKY